MQVTLTKVFITDKKKDGTQLINKHGKNYWKVGIKTKEHGDKWLSTFANKHNDPIMAWKEGDVVGIIVEQNGEYLNFKVEDEKTTQNNELMQRVEILEKEVRFLKSMMTGKVQHEEVQNIAKEFNGEITVDQIPF